MQRFEGKTLLVTGATSGIGLATARRLRDEGAHIVITGHNRDHLSAAIEKLPGATAILNDAAAPDSAPSLAKAITAQAGPLDGAFLNAGFGAFATLENIDADAIDRHVALNFRGPLLQAKALAPIMKDGGALLLISSATVGSPRADGLIYSAVKAALRQAVRSLATELAPRGIRVNAVTPGATETNFHTAGGMSPDAQAAYKQKTIAAVPLKRLGRPEDVAAAACFLLSTEASYITGTELRVDGGLSMA